MNKATLIRTGPPSLFGLQPYAPPFLGNVRLKRLKADGSDVLTYDVWHFSPVPAAPANSQLTRRLVKHGELTQMLVIDGDRQLESTPLAPRRE